MGSIKTAVKDNLMWFSNYETTKSKMRYNTYSIVGSLKANKSAKRCWTGVKELEKANTLTNSRFV